MKVWLDGKIVEESEARLSVFDHGLLYGDGVFEGIRFYKRRIFRLEEHTDRLFRSAHILGMDMPFDRDALNDAQRRAAEAHESRGNEHALGVQAAQQVIIQQRVQRRQVNRRFTAARCSRAGRAGAK